MKTNLKTFLSFAVLVAFAILGGGSSESEIGIAVIIGIVIVAIMIIGNQRSNEAIEKHKEEQRAKREEWRRIRTEEYNKDRKAMLDEFGEPDKTIVLESFKFNKEINVYEQKQILFMEGGKYEFKDLLSCSISDHSKIINGKATAVTNTNTGSAIGRGIVGAVIAGPAGAVIGGSTAKKTTEIHQSTGYTSHDYTVIVNVDSISNPVVQIHVGSREDITNEIAALLNVIISRNKTN